MTFDSNLAWKQASSAIAANREVLLALAGVFFLLPTLAFGLLLPAPQPSAGMSEQETMAMVSEFYVSVAPFVIPMVLVQATGTLAMLTLFTDRSRPTVGEAIRQGLAGVVPYFLAQLILGLGMGLVGGVLLAIGAVTGSPVVVGLAITAVILLAIYAGIKTSLVAPVIAVEQARNPLAALRRSWTLTRGNSVRIGLFYLLVFVAFLVVMMAALAIVGTLAALLLGPQAGETTSTVISAALGTIMSLYFVGIIAAVHRQLAGSSPEAMSAPFD